MKRQTALTMLTFLLILAFVSGCAEKNMLKGEAATQKQVVSAETMPAAQLPGNNMKADGEVKRRALQEHNEREAALKEQSQKEAAAQKKATATVAPAKELYEFTDIHFGFDNFDLKGEARVIVDKHAAWLNKNKDVKITIEGHCDERGTEEYNLALGDRRANAAAKYLIDMGIDGKRIIAISYGSERPLDPQHNETAWARNRRVHFAVTGVSK